MWKCPKCETINNTEQCWECGERQPAQPTASQNPMYAQQNVPYAYHRKEVRRENNNNGLIITVVICVTFIVALLLALGAYIFMQDHGDGDEKARTAKEAVPVYSSVPSYAVPELEDVATPTPAPTPTPKPDYTKVREGYYNRAEAIEQYSRTYLEPAMTQHDMNRESGEVFQKWDDLLNEVYQYLKQILPSSQFEVLKKEEMTWISRKEKAMEEEEKAWSGGSGAPMAVNGVGISYTKGRCYELIEMIR